MLTLRLHDGRALCPRTLAQCSAVCRALGSGHVMDEDEVLCVVDAAGRIHDLDGRRVVMDVRASP
jgi:hypothetical protein